MASSLYRARMLIFHNYHHLTSSFSLTIRHRATEVQVIHQQLVRVCEGLLQVRIAADTVLHANMFPVVKTWRREWYRKVDGGRRVRQFWSHPRYLHTMRVPEERWGWLLDAMDSFRGSRMRKSMTGGMDVRILLLDTLSPMFLKTTELLLGTKSFIVIDKGTRKKVSRASMTPPPPLPPPSSLLLE